ncbi:MAG: haloacid dehalogenase type II [Pseudomonas sp.]|uniref:haloacid dehalogenase type II n=1 Tax=Halopseudomonas laoshanensis TaxID=2268758 RepID=UPI001B60DDA0|nr:haloacid dehalogenase type II [Pseudomonas sp.]MBQ0776614.1 haloacid dehalogenase type II [Pseudomonas sp.]
MSEPRPTPIIVFDVNETLLDITSLSPLFERVFGDGAVLREWFTQLILYSQTMTLSGRYAPFGKLAVGALHMLGTIHGITIKSDDIDEFKQRMSVLPAHPDAAPALETLRDAGFRLVTLSNSASAASPTPLERAGLADFFERSFSVEAVSKFKPAPETYQWVASELNVSTAQLVLVACHFWDTAGAQAAGCSGALVTRSHNAVLPLAELPAPDLIAEDLGVLAQKIIARWGAP